MQAADFYSLRQVADLTGLSEFTLRGWEARYKAFEPDRTDTGRRQYSKNDIKRAFLLRELTNTGHRIGDIAQFSNSALEKRLDRAQPKSIATSYEVGDQVEAILKLTLLQDWDKLKKLLSDSLKTKKNLAAIEKIILPLLTQVGIYVATDRLSIAQEHILSSLIKEQLYTLLSKVSMNTKLRPNFSVVIAAPEGDYHEIGILIAHVIFNSLGVRSLFLGSNTPKNELCETALRFGATHILLASTICRKQGAQEEIFSYVHYVDQHIPKSMTLWFGGRNFGNLNLSLERNFKYFSSLQDLPNSIEESLKTKRKEP